MTSEVHITRTEPISRVEWLAIVEADGELRVTSANEEQVVCHWMTHKVRGESPWFIWYDGSIDAPLRDRKTLGKVISLALRLNGSVTDDNGQEYTRPDDFHRPGSDLPIPRGVLGNLLWSFPDDVPTDRAGFDAAVWARQYASGNNFCWDPDEVALGMGQVRVAGNNEAIELVSENGISFTAGELLWKVHRAFAEQLAGSHHRFLEGLWLHPPSLVNGSPLYHLRLGS